MGLDGRTCRAVSTAQQSKWVYDRIATVTIQMCDTLHLPARLVPRLRVTSPQPPSFRQRIATAQERDECLSGVLPNNLPTFATTHGY
jgi:hypothetical protein